MLVSFRYQTLVLSQDRGKQILLSTDGDFEAGYHDVFTLFASTNTPVSHIILLRLDGITDMYASGAKNKTSSGINQWLFRWRK